MITASTDLQNIFKQQTSIRTDIGCEIEYNMNSLIDGISVTSATLDTAYTNEIDNWPLGKANPYKKLFPVDSIIKPFRPLNSGVKYFILLPNDTTANSFSAYRTLQYPNTQPRIYYPGVTTFYKYWLSAINANVDLTVTYKQASNPVSGNKIALANKVVARFEKYHALPTNYTITITKSDDSTSVIGPTSTPSNGLITLYYNGSSWSSTAPSEPITYAMPISIKSIRLQATNPGGDKVVGVIELSARWVKDISSDIESFSINKESSSRADDILPVGNITANSLSLNLVKYDEIALQVIPYNRLSESFNSSLIYMAKNAEIRPHVKVYHSNGAIGTSPNKYDKVQQGTYFMNDWSISEYGDSSLTALDGSKYLMETLCPDILCEFYPVTAILRRLLDSIGFTNYNFNLATTETSVPQINYWWTDDTRTVWEAIQELCRDIQMNAFFDENNTLQFYSRDYIYDTTRSASWNFYQEAEGSTLPNIISFTQKEVVAANYVKVLWQSPITSNYVGTSTKLWDAPTTFLSAGGLLEAMTNSSTEIKINTKTIDANGNQQSFYQFQGFVLIDSEVIEYDAIGYDCVLLNGTKEHNWITSESDVNKYRYLCKSGYADVNNPESAYFKPSGRYRVKTRGALGTTAAAHYPANDKLVEWTGKEVLWT